MIAIVITIMTKVDNNCIMEVSRAQTTAMLLVELNHPIERRAKVKK